jgi:hypothetical protein
VQPTDQPRVSSIQAEMVLAETSGVPMSQRIHATLARLGVLSSRQPARTTFRAARDSDEDVPT